MLQKTVPLNNQEITFNEFKKEVLQDYRIAKISRECSLLGRREVLTGKRNLVFLVTEKKYHN